MLHLSQSVCKLSKLLFPPLDIGASANQGVQLIQVFIVNTYYLYFIIASSNNNLLILPHKSYYLLYFIIKFNYTHIKLYLFQ